MSGSVVSLLDGRLPSKVTLDRAPDDVETLLVELGKVDPERAEDLGERCRKGQMVVYVNSAKLETLDRKLTPEDRVVILTNMAGG